MIFGIMDPKSSKSSVWGHDDLPMLTRAVSISSMPMVNKETLQLWHLKRELQEDWCAGGGYHLEYDYPVAFVGYPQDGAVPKLLGD